MELWIHSTGLCATSAKAEDIVAELTARRKTQRTHVSVKTWVPCEGHNFGPRFSIQLWDILSLVMCKRQVQYSRDWRREQLLITKISPWFYCFPLERDKRHTPASVACMAVQTQEAPG